MDSKVDKTVLRQENIKHLKAFKEVMIFVLKMFEMIKNIWNLLPNRRKYQSILIILITTFAAFAELLLLLSFMLMINKIINPEKNEISKFFNQFSITNLDLNLYNINYLFLIFILCVLGTGFLRLILLWSTIRFSFICTSDFAKNIFINTLNQPLKFHLKNSSNEILNGLTKRFIFVR